MHPNIYLSSFPINVYTFAAWGGFFIAAAYMYTQLIKIQYIKRSHVLLAIFLGCFVQHFGGAVIGYFYILIYFHEVRDLASFSASGRYFHSVFLSVLVYLLVLCRLLRWPTKKVLDIYAIAVLLMSAIGRIGCYFEGCCVGKPAPPPWGVQFAVHPGQYLIPTQLYMLATETLLCLLLVRINKEKKYDGQTFWTAVLLYSIYRFIIEFFRTNPVFIFGFSHAQAFSLFTLGLAWIVLARHKTEPGNA